MRVQCSWRLYKPPPKRKLFIVIRNLWCSAASSCFLMLALCSLTAFAFFDLLFFSVASSPPFLFFFPEEIFYNLLFKNNIPNRSEQTPLEKACLYCFVYFSVILLALQVEIFFTFQRAAPNLSKTFVKCPYSSFIHLHLDCIRYLQIHVVTSPYKIKNWACKNSFKDNKTKLC